MFVEWMNGPIPLLAWKALVISEKAFNIDRDKGINMYECLLWVKQCSRHFYTLSHLILTTL